MIKASKLQLRVIMEKDLANLYKKFTDPAIRGYFYPFHFIPESLFYAEFSKNGFWTEDSKRLVITDFHDNLMGMIHIFKACSYNDSLELSYILLENAQQNKGLITEALTSCVSYLFKSSRINRIQLTMATEHKASIRVAEKAGFRQEGVMRGALLIDSKDHDLFLYALLKQDWLDLK